MYSRVLVKLKDLKLFFNFKSESVNESYFKKVKILETRVKEAELQAAEATKRVNFKLTYELF